MLVDEQAYHSIWWDKQERKIRFINQNHLPFRFVVDEMNTADDALDAIKQMKVRGAPLIGVTAAFGMYLAVKESSAAPNPVKYVTQRAAYLKSARPTAVNLSRVVTRVEGSIAYAADQKEREQVALELALQISEEEVRRCFAIGRFGLDLIRDAAGKKDGSSVHILTHCNAGWLAAVDYGTALAPVYLAHKEKIPVHVWVDETRPRNQGARLTAWELKQQGVPHTVIADNTGGHLMQHGMVDMVITGSDRTTLTGDVANKIGTYLKALAAHDNGVPFYVAVPSSSFDFRLRDGIREIPIEERDGDELRYAKGISGGRIGRVGLFPDEHPVVNYGFDITPARLVTALITERGICQANEPEIGKLFGDLI